MSRRRLLGLAGLASGSALLAACVSISFPNNAGATTGSGNTGSESRPIADVRAIVVGGSGRLEYVLDPRESLTIEAEANILPLLRSDVEDGVLTLGPKPGASFSTTREIVYKLTLPRVPESLDMTGSTSARIPELKGGGPLSLKLDGSSRAIIANLFTDGKVTVDLRGSSQLTISAGVATSQEVSVTGSASYTADGFSTRSGTVTATNSGSALVNVTEALDATAENSGSIKYVGSPSLNKRVKDSGKVSPR